MQDRRNSKPVKIVSYRPKKCAAENLVEYLGIILATDKSKDTQAALKSFCKTFNEKSFLAISLSSQRHTVIKNLKYKARQNSALYNAGYVFYIVGCDESLSLLFSGKKPATEVIKEHLQKIDPETHDISTYYPFYVNPPLCYTDRYLANENELREADDEQKLARYKVS